MELRFIQLYNHERRPESVGVPSFAEDSDVPNANVGWGPNRTLTNTISWIIKGSQNPYSDTLAITEFSLWETAYGFRLDSGQCSDDRDHNSKARQDQGNKTHDAATDAGGQG